MSLSAARTPSTVHDLTLTRERGRQPVNEFLEQHHPLGAVPGWKACFSGRYDDLICAVVVVGRPVARFAPDGELNVTRYAIRPDCARPGEPPYNIGSWLIARAREWAYLEGYETISAHAGVAGNYGTVYAAAGFEQHGEPELVNGASWSESRPGRESRDDYQRRKWVYHLRGDGE